MINPLVYEVPDAYMHDSVKEAIHNMTTTCVELYSFKWHVVKYIPLFILNKLKVPVSMSQSIMFRVKFPIRYNMNNAVNNITLNEHVKTVIKSQLMIKLHMMRKGCK